MCRDNIFVIYIILSSYFIAMQGNLYAPQDRLDRVDYTEDQSDVLPGTNRRWNNAYWNDTPTEYLNMVTPPGSIDKAIGFFQRSAGMPAYQFTNNEKILIGVTVLGLIWLIGH
jgi:hypothetical protein